MAISEERVGREWEPDPRRRVTRAVLLADPPSPVLQSLAPAIPPALLPVFGVPLIEHQLRAMARAGITEARIVVGRHARLIESRLGDGFRFGLRLRYLVTTDPMKLGDALQRVDPAGGPVLVSRRLCFLDIDLRTALDRHRSSGAAVSVIAPSEATALAPVLFVYEPGILQRLQGSPEGSPGFSGPSDLGGDDAVPLDIHVDGYLHTVASADDLREIHAAGLAGRFGVPVPGKARVAPGTLRGGWTGSRVRVAPRATVIDSVLEEGSVVESGAVVVRSVVLAGTRVGSGEVLRDSVAYLGIRVGPDGLRAAPPETARHLRRRRLDLGAVFGWAVALVLLMVLLPVIALCAMAILIEDGRPVFFVHKRVGQERRRVSRDSSRRVVGVLKFRTMYKEGDPRRVGPEWKDEGDDAIFTLAKGSEDPRLTKVGRFLRRTSLDEIPQLFNVLRGDMRLVGNRPLGVSEADRMVEEWHQLRFRAPQGITGLWQVSGRSELSDEERLALDNYYAASRSFWLDLRILVRTFPAVVSRKGAK